MAHRRQPPGSVLLIVTRRIGDVLLATPLLRSIKQAWPDAAIDVLVFEGTQGILAANPDIHRLIAVPERPARLAHLALLLRLARRYDMALSTLQGDRPTLYAFVAGRWRAGLLTDSRKERWKQRLLQQWVPFDDANTHTVRMNLALTRVLGIVPQADVSVRWAASDAERANALAPATPYAVLHPYPKFNYKMWRREGWITVAERLLARGLGVVLSGGPDAAERAYVTDIARGLPPRVVNAAGQLSLGASACLVSQAAVYVGPDTAMTHAAAALGVPTIALFGPTNIVKWGPWPRGHDVSSNPWRRIGSQRAGNVTLLQGAGACVPCALEGCQRHVASFSDCLQSLPLESVIAAINERLQ
jgi:heptosyltransferase III